MNKEVYDLAHKIADEWCYKNQLSMIGAKKIDNYIYVRGYDGGFPMRQLQQNLILTQENLLRRGDFMDALLRLQMECMSKVGVNIDFLWV